MSKLMTPEIVAALRLGLDVGRFLERETIEQESGRGDDSAKGVDVAAAQTVTSLPGPILTDFVAIVRAALDDTDDRPDLDYWRIRDPEAFARLLLTHIIAASLAVPPQLTLRDIEEGRAA